jgi:hypothetical protein
MRRILVTLAIALTVLVTHIGLRNVRTCWAQQSVGTRTLGQSTLADSWRFALFGLFCSVSPTIRALRKARSPSAALG